MDDSVPTSPQAKNGAMITLQVSPRSILTCFLFTKPLQDAQISHNLYYVRLLGRHISMSSKLKEKDKGGKFLMKLWSCVGGKLGRIYCIYYTVFLQSILLTYPDS